MLGFDLMQSSGLLVEPAHLTESPKRFADGSHCRIELPSVEGPEVFEALLTEADQRRVPVHRVSQGSGVTMLTAAERSQWARRGAETQTEICLYIRPTASWGTGAAWRSATGATLAGQAHGVAQLAACLDQVKRAAESGFRSVLITDFGVLAAVAQLKDTGVLPPDLQLKAGVQMSVANPWTAKVVSELGACSINVASDCSLADLAAIRAAVDNPLDIYIESPDDLGGFIRLHEIADIVRVAAPVYLKFGVRNAPSLYPNGTHTMSIATALARERVRRAQIGLELLSETGGAELVVSKGASDLGIPALAART